MTHYAVLNDQNVVEEVFEGVAESDGVDGETHYSLLLNKNVKKTCQHTFGNRHVLDPFLCINGPKPFRKNFARVGMIYDETLDGFIHPKKFEGWEFDPETGTWIVPPVPEELIGKGILEWDNDTQSWYVLQEKIAE